MKNRPDPVPPEVTAELQRVCSEIKACIKQGRGLPKGAPKRGYHSRIAEYIGMSSQQLSKRLSGEYELEADVFLGICLRMEAPPGWPQVSWISALAAFGPRNKKP